MKRIISLILVVIMALSVFTACAYDYSKDDMSNYATIDSEKFFEALKDLVVTDGDFGTDETERWNKVVNAIFVDIGNTADKENKVTEGIPGAHDLLYYCYYATYDGNVFFASNMKESSAAKIQLGLTTTEGYQKALAEFVATVDIKDYIYKTNTTDAAKGGDMVYVSYDMKVGSEDTKKVSYELITLPAAADETFAGKLIGVKPGEAAKSFDITEGGVEKKYTNVKIGWVVDSMVELGTGFTYKPYEKGGETGKSVKDIYGKEHDLRDKELTYHVFPVYSVPVEDLNAETVLYKFYSSLTASKADEEDSTKTVYLLDFVQNGGFKKGEDDMVKLLTTLGELQTALTDAKSKVESAKSDLESKEKVVADKGDSATDTDKNNVTLAQQDLDKAEDDLEKAQKDVDDQVEEILAATNDKNEVIADEIVADYKQYRYDSLEKTYKQELKENLAKEIYAIAEDLIEYKKDENGRILLPTKAVNKAYKRLDNNYKYKFYEGKYDDGDSSTTDSKTNYEIYGDYFTYLKEDKNALNLGKDATKQQIYDAIGAKAEASVKELVLVYVIADLCEGNAAVTDEDIEEFKNGFNYWYLAYMVGEDNVETDDFIHAIQLDNALNYILEEDEYDDNVVKYKRVQYTTTSK